MGRHRAVESMSDEGLSSRGCWRLIHFCAATYRSFHVTSVLIGVRISLDVRGQNREKRNEATLQDC